MEQDRAGVLDCSGCAVAALCPCARRGHLGQGQRRRAWPQGPLQGSALPVYGLNIAEHTGHAQLGGVVPRAAALQHSHLPDVSPTQHSLTPEAHTQPWSDTSQHHTAGWAQRDLKGHLASAPAKMQEFGEKNSVTKYLSCVQEIMQE